MELGLWAVASDYARLDTVYRMGGIYMDMDIELLKPLDSFLGNKAIFSFANNVNVDLAFFAGVQGNALIKHLLSLYDNIKPPSSRKEYNKYFQPNIVARTMYDFGLKFDGSLQMIDGIAFLPKNYLMPLDVILFSLDAKDNRTHAIHWDNYGWYYGISDARRQKELKNKKLWEMIV